MFLYVTRHGQPLAKEATQSADDDPQYPVGDPPLSELGRLQAEKLGKRLRDVGFRGRIYASPYRRTAETADCIARVTGLTFLLAPEIREYSGPNIVNFHGLPLEQLRRLFPRLAPEAELPYPWWSMAEEPADETGYRPRVIARAGQLLERIMAPEGPDALLVGHGASIGATVKYLFQRGIQCEFSRTGKSWNVSLTAFRLDHDGVFPLYHGDVTHLDPAEITANSQRPEDFV